MSESFIESYLVKLGFSTDEPSFRQLTGIMGKAESSITTHTGGIVKRLLEAQGAIVGAFTSVSAAIIGLVDRTAMADQSYRLLGMRMMMTGEQARKMSMITTALGVSVEDIVWDKETQERAQAMSRDIDHWTKALGSDFEPNMRGIRDFRNEFSRLGVAAQFVGMSFVNKLWKDLAPGKAGKDFHDWISNLNIDELATKLETYAKPALIGTWEILKGLGEVAKGAMVAFSNLVGLISNDQSIQGSTFSFDNLAKAVGHVGDWMIKLELLITQAEGALIHFATAAELVFEKDYAGAIRQIKEARDEFKSSPESRRDRPEDELAGYGKSLRMSTMLQDLPEVIGPDGKRITGTDFLDDLADRYEKYKGKSLAEVSKGEGANEMIDNMMDDTSIGRTAKRVDTAIDIAAKTGDEIDSLAGFAGGGVQPAGGFKKKPGETKNEAAIRLWNERVKEESKQAKGPTVAERHPWSGSKAENHADLISKIHEGIAKYEAGSKPNPISERNNNPGNLRSWKGVPTIDGYAKFPTKEAGGKALDEQIQRNIDRGLTLKEFFAGKEGAYYGYAPEKDHNHPGPYADYVSRYAGIDSDVPLNQLQKSAPKEQEWPSIILTPTPDSKPISPISYTQPRASNSNFDRNWDVIAASMDRPVAPSPNISNSQHSTHVEVGGITIVNPGADEHQIKRAISDGIQEAMFRQTQLDITQLNPQYA